jgi:hypothetical protein
VPNHALANSPARHDTYYDSLRSETSKTQATKRKDWNPDDVAEFKPERWLDDGGKFDMKAGPIAAFGQGARSCFGQRLAVSWEVIDDID